MAPLSALEIKPVTALPFVGSEEILPPRPSPCLPESCMLTMSPGTKKPESSEVLKLTTSVWLTLVHNFHLAYRRAWPSEVHPNAIASCLISLPVFAIFSESSNRRGSRS